jgi:UDP-2,4-diacetamido-2,4,6-trideoxy-beta-L-altropyranose hydrolase
MEQMENQCLVFRVDGSAAAGTGHIMRCLALAQAWREAGGRACFISAKGFAALEERLRSEGCEVLSANFVPGSISDARWTAAAARQRKASWIVVDGYHFGADYQQAMKDSRASLLFIDDCGHSGRYAADIVLNQNLYASEDLYRDRASYTRLLLGTEYALLRREFAQWREWPREISAAARNILVTLGGVDSANITQKVLDVLQRLDLGDTHIKIVAGVGNVHLESLRHAVGEDGRVELLTAVDDMAQLMVWADLAISAAGSTCWELASTGLPSCVVVLADNQLPVARSLEEAGAAVNIGWWRDDASERLLAAVTTLREDAERRRRMSEIGTHIVDAAGARRVTERLMERPVTKSSLLVA